LRCPADTPWVWATNFSVLNNSNISYFVGLDAKEAQPQLFLSGDDNFAISGVPVKSGLLQLWTNTPIAWTKERHKHTGNILFADGSVVQTDDKSLVEKLQATGPATNRLAIP
jgi:prepilin-type processing-associated H-X9-DG protein